MNLYMISKKLGLFVLLALLFSAQSAWSGVIWRLEKIMNSFLFLLLFVAFTSVNATPVSFDFYQNGFDEGASVTGMFAGEDLNGDGQLSGYVSGYAEVSGFKMNFSGNSLVPAFSLDGLATLYDLVYDLDGGPLGDGSAENITAALKIYSYDTGSGSGLECGNGEICAVVMDFYGDITTTTSSQLVFVSPMMASGRLYTLNDPTPNDYDQFGFSIASVGDINGDSISDIAVGAFNADVDGLEAVGEAFVYSGADGSLLYQLSDPQGKKQGVFGYFVVGVGDVNGDTVPDIAVGAPESNAGRFPGRAIVFSGSDGGVLYSLNNSTLSDDADLGISLAALGDVTGDSVPDIAATAQGQLLIFSGIDGSLIDTLWSAATLNRWPVISLGDVTGDSQPEVAVSSGEQVLILSVEDGTLIHTLSNPNPQGLEPQFGYSLASVEDLDGDAISDIAVGAPGQDGDNNRQGQAFIFSGADGTLLHTVNNPDPQEDALFGNSIAGLGDVDGDFVPDVAIGAPRNNNQNQGQVFIFSGADGTLLHTVNNPDPQEDALFGNSIAGLGDVDGNTVPDIAIGAVLQDVAGFEDQGQVSVFTLLQPASVPVAINIKPGNKRNVINPRAKGDIWVAILADTDPTSPFDPSSQVDIPTVEFGPDGAKAIRHKVKDINKDGLGDLLLRFEIPQTGIACGDTDATLIGKTFDGQSFTGTDSIKTVGCKPQ